MATARCKRMVDAYPLSAGGYVVIENRDNVVLPAQEFETEYVFDPPSGG